MKSDNFFKILWQIGKVQQMYLFDDGIAIGGVECFLQILTFRQLAFGYVHEHVGNLQDVIDVGFNTTSPFLHFVLVTCDLERKSCANKYIA